MSGESRGTKVRPSGLCEAQKVSGVRGREFRQHNELTRAWGNHCAVIAVTTPCHTLPVVHFHGAVRLDSNPELGC